MFDRMEWWQVLLLLAPIAAVMSWIRRRELLAGMTSFGELSGAQKAWILLMLLPPGLAATLLGEFTEDEVTGYLGVSRSIRGPGRNLVKPVLKEFFQNLPPKFQRRRGEPSDLLELAIARADEYPSEVVEAIRTNWSSPDPKSLPRVKTISKK